MIMLNGAVSECFHVRVNDVYFDDTFHEFEKINFLPLFSDVSTFLDTGTSELYGSIIEFSKAEKWYICQYFIKNKEEKDEIKIEDFDSANIYFYGNKNNTIDFRFFRTKNKENGIHIYRDNTRANKIPVYSVFLDAETNPEDDKSVLLLFYVLMSLILQESINKTNGIECIINGSRVPVLMLATNIFIDIPLLLFGEKHNDALKSAFNSYCESVGISSTSEEYKYALDQYKFLCDENYKNFYDNSLPAKLQDIQNLINRSLVL